MPNSEQHATGFADGHTLAVGILIGGQSRRMGGKPKGLLRAPGSDETLVERLWRIAGEELPGASRVLLGQHVAYAHLGYPMLPDVEPGAGPLAGLASLLARARDEGRGAALLLACDLPRVTGALLGRLAREEPEALALAPFDGVRYEPLFARYSVGLLDVCAAAVTGQDRSLQPVLRGARAARLSLDQRESALLADWDTPGDP